MIEIKDDAVYIDGDDYTLDDVVKAVQQNPMSASKAKQNDSNYWFDLDFYLGQNEKASLTIKSANVYITGEYFQVYQDSSLYIGDKDASKYTDGVSLMIPNIKTAYGFGCKDKDGDYSQSGNLYAYCSKLQIPGFWGFFNKEKVQVVEIIDCQIDGFGRFSGNNTIVKDCVFGSPNKKYGTISTLGKVKEISNINIINLDSDRVPLYFYGNYSKNATIKNVSAHGYDNLVNCKDGSRKYTLTLIDPDIDDNLQCKFDGNKTYIEIDYSLTFLSENKDRSIKILYDDDVVDSFVLKNKDTSSLKYVVFNKDDSTYYKDYQIEIDGIPAFKITPDRQKTIDIDTYFSTVRPSDDNQFFMISEKTGTLGSIFEFAVKSYTEPEIALLTNEGKKIASPFSLTNIKGNLYNVSFYIDDLGEKGENDLTWKDGIYILEGSDGPENFFSSISIIREEEHCATKRDNQEVLNKLEELDKDVQYGTDEIETNSRGAKLYF